MLNTDFAPTFSAAAGTSMGSTDGLNFASLLSDPRGDWRSDFLIEHGGQVSGGNATGLTYCGVRTENYAYAQYWDGFEELYNLNNDASEMQNVAGWSQYHSVLSSLRSRAHQLCDPVPPGFHWSH
jgi:hypothetical protein